MWTLQADLQWRSISRLFMECHAANCQLFPSAGADSSWEKLVLPPGGSLGISWIHAKCIPVRHQARTSLVPEALTKLPLGHEDLIWRYICHDDHDTSFIIFLTLWLLVPFFDARSEEVCSEAMYILSIMFRVRLSLSATHQSDCS